MTERELILRAQAAYGEDLIGVYEHPAAAADCVDPLTLTIVNELVVTYRPNDPDKLQLETAAQTLHDVCSDLRRVIDGLLCA